MVLDPQTQGWLQLVQRCREEAAAWLTAWEGSFRAQADKQQDVTAGLIS